MGRKVCTKFFNKINISHWVKFQKVWNLFCFYKVWNSVLEVGKIMMIIIVIHVWSCSNRFIRLDLQILGSNTCFAG
jgi:hypothetical protein